MNTEQIREILKQNFSNKTICFSVKIWSNNEPLKVDMNIWESGTNTLISGTSLYDCISKLKQYLNEGSAPETPDINLEGIENASTQTLPGTDNSDRV